MRRNQIERKKERKKNSKREHQILAQKLQNEWNH